jgi:hypothetical protein
MPSDKISVRSDVKNSRDGAELQRESLKARKGNASRKYRSGDDARRPNEKPKSVAGVRRKSALCRKSKRG